MRAGGPLDVAAAAARGQRQRRALGGTRCGRGLLATPVAVLQRYGARGRNDHHAQTPGGHPARVGGSTSSHRCVMDPCERAPGEGAGLAHEASMIRKTHTSWWWHAHPDDEASSTGGLLRFAAEQGHTTIVVTCTHGDCGEVKIPGLRLHPRQVPADRQRLALIRQEELAHAAALLGVTHVYQLGYHDSGMAGWASNQQRQALCRRRSRTQPAAWCALIRRHRPEVVVTYDAHGGYGHPDHIRLCRKIAFSGQSPKIVYWKIKDLRVQTFLFSVICYRAGSYASRPCSLRNSPVLRPEDNTRHVQADIILRGARRAR